MFQDEIARDPKTRGSMFVPIILGSNKTTVSIATGQTDYYPLYISIGNIHNNIWQAHGDGVILTGLLAIAKSKLPFYVLHTVAEPSFTVLWRWQGRSMPIPLNFGVFNTSSFTPHSRTSSQPCERECCNLKQFDVLMDSIKRQYMALAHISLITLNRCLSLASFRASVQSRFSISVYQATHCGLNLSTTL